MRTYLCALVATLLPAAAFCQPAGHQTGHSDHMEHRFDDPEGMAKRFDDPARDAWQMPDRVVAALDLKPGQSVADIGAGTGYFSMRLAKSAARPKVYAVDIEPAMVAYLKQRAAKDGLPNVEAVQGGTESPNLPAPVDVVLIVDTYHHIGDRVAYFRKLRGSLKPGGRVAIVDFKPDSPEGPPAEFRFSPQKFQTEMAEAGYRMVKQYEFLPRQNFLLFAAK